MPVGSKLALGIIRNGKPMNVEVTLSRARRAVASDNIFSGIEGAELNNAAGGKGVKVDNVKKGSTAARIGLQKGDVIPA